MIKLLTIAPKLIPVIGAIGKPLATAYVVKKSSEKIVEKLTYVAIPSVAVLLIGTIVLM